jgi:hypothetical protein
MAKDAQGKAIPIVIANATNFPATVIAAPTVGAAPIPGLMVGSKPAEMPGAKPAPAKTPTEWDGTPAGPKKGN